MKKFASVISSFSSTYKQNAKKFVNFYEKSLDIKKIVVPLQQFFEILTYITPRYGRIKVYFNILFLLTYGK